MPVSLHIFPGMPVFNFWSHGEVVGDLRSCVCLYVRTSARLILGNRSLLFSETLQLVRACKREKNVPSAFLIIFYRFGQKQAKIGHLAGCVQHSL